MTKRAWAGLMISSLVITLAAGCYLLLAFQEKSTIVVPLEAVKNPEPPLDEAPPAEVPVETDETVTPPPPEPEPVSQEPEFRNILFSLHSSQAKKVFIVGDFNNWYRQPLEKKKGNMWSTSLKIKPGAYDYLYVVDNRRIPDPNNQRRSEDGQSILIVYPLSKN